MKAKKKERVNCSDKWTVLKLLRNEIYSHEIRLNSHSFSISLVILNLPLRATESFPSSIHPSMLLFNDPAKQNT